QQRENTRMRDDIQKRGHAVTNEEWGNNLRRKIASKQKELIQRKSGRDDLKTDIENEQRTQQLYQLQLEDVKLQKESLAIQFKMQQEQYQGQGIGEQPELALMILNIKSADEQINFLEQEA